MPTVLHVSPHADDEALGAPATLLRLRRAGWRVVNVVTSVGRGADAERRGAEAADAARRAGFELVLPGGRSVTDELASAVRSCGPDLVVSPSSDDAHPRHRAVASATATVLASLTTPPVWWQWALWADLRAPTLYVAFTEDVLEEARHVLDAYVGELTRNDYDQLLRARATVQAVIGAERVFGFGSSRASAAPYAELLTELRPVDGTWRAGPPRHLDPRDPLARRGS